MSSTHSFRKTKNKIDDRGIKLDDFTGQVSPEDYLEWERQVEKIAEYKGFDDTQTFKIAYIRLTKNAGLWYEGLKAKCQRHGKPKIMTCSHLTRKMRDKYVPLDFDQQSYIKLTSLYQGTMSVREYISEFEKCTLPCDTPSTPSASNEKPPNFLPKNGL